jgi:hypothetical protein
MLQMSYKDVPAPWVFEFYCRLPGKLAGEKVRIKSLFNEQDTNPSMVIYFDEEKKKFRFKCFSSGKGGDGMDLVMKLYGLNYHDAERKMTQDYYAYCSSNGSYSIAEGQYRYSSYKVTEYKKRLWNTDDSKYWTSFNIGSKLLERYCVAPLEHYVMEKEGCYPITIRNAFLYGYFTKSGELYKIYQPKIPDRKFIKADTWATGYIQGYQQLAGHELLVITSSLKDIMGIASLKLKVDLVAPDSENTPFTKEQLDSFRDKYPFIGVLMDNDAAGIKAMERYRDEYGLAPILLPMSKDPSDSIRDSGPLKVRNRLVPLLNSVMDQYAMAA